MRPSNFSDDLDMLLSYFPCDGSGAINILLSQYQASPGMSLHFQPHLIKNWQPPWPHSHPKLPHETLLSHPFTLLHLSLLFHFSLNPDKFSSLTSLALPTPRLLHSWHRHGFWQPLHHPLEPGSSLKHGSQILILVTKNSFPPLKNNFCSSFLR